MALRSSRARPLKLLVSWWVFESRRQQLRAAAHSSLAKTDLIPRKSEPADETRIKSELMGRNAAMPSGVARH